MERKAENRGTALEWIALAKGDLAIAQIPLPERAFREALCFHAQQAAEKAVKAIYQHLNKRFLYTHNIRVLLEGLETDRIFVPEHVKEADILTDYAVDARYPGLEEPVDDEELREAIRLAESVIAWAESQLI